VGGAPANGTVEKQILYSMKKGKIVILFTFLLILAACSSPEKRWERAKADNTITAYNEFIEKFPGSKFRQEATIAIEKLSWDIAINTRTDSLLEDCIIKYPTSPRIPEAKTLLTRLKISMLNNAFRIQSAISDQQVTEFMQHIEQETFAAPVKTMVTHYYSSGNNCDDRLTKGKQFIMPGAIGKACSLRLELGELSITAFYSSNPIINYPLFIDKYYPTMTHNGCSGPGLELESTTKTEAFLKTFQIHYNLIHGTDDFVIPDLIWKADEPSGYGHYGDEVKITNEIIRVEGRTCDIDKLPKTISVYKKALEIKTYIKTMMKD
jgi:hypothetical protein